MGKNCFLNSLFILNGDVCVVWQAVQILKSDAFWLTFVEVIQYIFATIYKKTCLYLYASRISLYGDSMLPPRYNIPFLCEPSSRVSVCCGTTSSKWKTSFRQAARQTIRDLDILTKIIWSIENPTKLTSSPIIIGWPSPCMLYSLASRNLMCVSCVSQSRRAGTDNSSKWLNPTSTTFQRQPTCVIMTPSSPRRPE